jgi:hypothetical protein
MSDQDQHEGGCLCGQVRFRVTGEPSRAAVCHCRYCQLRTGSAFAVSVYFELDKVEIQSGDLVSYEHPSQSGRNWHIQRCCNCGTNLFWTIDGEAWAGLLGTSGGCYDPPTFWYQLKREVFARSKAGFCTIDAPESLDTHPAYQPLGDDPGRLRGGD